MRATFEQELNDEWADERTDIYDGGIMTPKALDACRPIRPEQVLEYLKINEDELIGLLRTGKLARPGKQTKGRVAWRFDEVQALAPLRDR